jgi:flagellar motor switch protein FliM
MKEILSNEEIDTLLDLFRQEGPQLDAPAAAPRAAGGGESGGPIVSRVDLLKPNRLSREHIRAFERMFGSVAKSIAATMAEKLRVEVQCDCVAVEQIRFQGWLALLGGPTAIYSLKLPPLEAPSLFTVTTSLLYGAVDRILGGSGKVATVPKDFTAAEWVVADAFLGPCLDRVTQGLDDLAQLQWEVLGRFCNPSMAQILPSQEVVLSVHFQASGEFLLGDLRLVIPYSGLDAHLAKLDQEPGARWKKPPGTMREVLGRTVKAVPVEMSVVLGETSVPLRHLLALRAGDVVPLGTRVGQPLVAPVQGRPKFTGQVGRQGHRLAFQVGSVIG